jgi:hypothetical protein
MTIDHVVPLTLCRVRGRREHMSRAIVTLGDNCSKGKRCDDLWRDMLPKPLPQEMRSAGQLLDTVGDPGRI